MSPSPVIDTLLPALMAFIMVGMGMSLELRDFRRVVQYPQAAVAGLFGQLIVLPLIGFAIVTVLDLSPLMSVGIMLLAACPGGTMSNLICHLARGNTALSVTLTAFSSVITLMSIPLIVGLAVSNLLGMDSDVTLPVGRTLGFLFGIIVIPIAIGMIIRHRSPAFADRSDPFFRKTGLLLMAALVIGLTAAERDTLPTALAQVGLAAAALNLASTLAGILLGRMLRLGFRDMLTLGIEVGIQNSALAMVVGLSLMGDAQLALPAAVYSLVMYITAALIIFVAHRRPTPANSAASVS